MKAAVRKEMEWRGYRYDAEQPELRVSEAVLRRPGRAVDQTVTSLLRPLPPARRVD